VYRKPLEIRFPLHCAAPTKHVLTRIRIVTWKLHSRTSFNASHCFRTRYKQEQHLIGLRGHAACRKQQGRAGHWSFVQLTLTKRSKTSNAEDILEGQRRQGLRNVRLKLMKILDTQTTSGENRATFAKCNLATCTTKSLYTQGRQILLSFVVKQDLPLSTSNMQP